MPAQARSRGKPTGVSRREGTVSAVSDETLFGTDEVTHPGLPAPQIPDGADEVRAAAAGSLWLRRLIAFTDYVGPGRALTARGNLRLADAGALTHLLETGERLKEQIGNQSFSVRSATELSGVDLTLELALAVGFVEVQGSTLVRRPDAQLPREEPAVAWAALLTALLTTIGPHRHRWRNDTYRRGWWAPTADSVLAAAVMASAEGDEAVSVPALAEAAWAQVLAEFDLAGVEESMVAFHRESMSGQLLTVGLGRLLEFGAVELDAAASAALESRLNHEIGTPATPLAGSLRLTELGRWAATELAGEGSAMLAGMPAADMVDTLLELPLGLALTHTSAWLRAHPDGLPDLVTRILEIADDPGAAQLACGVVLRILVGAGPGPAEVVARFGEEAALTAYVKVWRLAVGLDPGPLPGVADPARLVELLAAAIMISLDNVGEPVLDLLRGPLTWGALIETIWRVRLQETELVLTVLEEIAMDKATSKAARKALDRHRSLPPVLHEIELPDSKPEVAVGPVGQVAQLKITLQGSKPPIWRRVLVPSDVTLDLLADVVLAAMNWDNEHLHAFRAGRRIFSDPDFDLEMAEDETRVQLSEVLSQEKAKIRFDYDFGDDWHHDIVLEKLLPAQGVPACPTVVAGRRACPPEDSGGVWGYADLLDAYADPASERHEDAVDWLGSGFSAEEFDLETTARLVEGLG